MTWDELVNGVRRIQAGEGDPRLDGYLWQGKQYEGLVVNGLEAMWASGTDLLGDNGDVFPDPGRAADALRFLAAPGMASAGLLAFLASWNEFLFAYTFTATERSRTVPVKLALFPGVFEVPWGDIAAAAVLASLPPILIVGALQRYLIQGLVAGAVKD